MFPWLIDIIYLLEINMRKSRTSSANNTAYFLYKDIMEIPKQYMHVSKNFSKVSPLRNIKNLKEINHSHNSSFSERLEIPKQIPNFPNLDNCYMKILKKATQNKENIKVRHLSVQKQRILSEIPEVPPSAFKMVEEESLNSYKTTQLKIKALTKNKLPPSLLKYKKDKSFDI